MKHLLIFTLLCVMLGGAMTATSSDMPTKNANKNYGTCFSTDSDGPLSADASITADVDYPGEGKNPLDKLKSDIETIIDGGYGIEYEASASVFGKAPNDDYKGESEVYAKALEDEDHKPRLEWRKKVDRKAKAKDRKELPKDHDWDDVHTKFELSSCSAWGDIDGASPEKDVWGWKRVKNVYVSPGSESEVEWIWEWVIAEERPAISHAAFAYAWNFPDPDENDGEEEAAAPSTLGLQLPSGASTITINGEEMVDTTPGDTVYVSVVLPSDKGYSQIYWYLAGPNDSGLGNGVGGPTYPSGSGIETEITQMFSMPSDASGVYTFTAYIYPHSSASDQTCYEYTLKIYCS